MSTEKKARVISLMGPTASGKTALAIDLRKHIPVEIISVDSALVYKGLDIGTAKPNAEELALAPHRLIDFLDPAQPYSVAEFCVDAKREIEDIIAQDKTPLLVGGTMLYFKALLEGLSDMPAASPLVRAQIEAEAEKLGWQHMHEELAKVDPVSAAKIHPNHSQRISRALEVYRASGKSLSQYHADNTAGLFADYDWVQIAIAPRDRSVLHKRIEERFDVMLGAGLENEVRTLFERGDLNQDLPAVRAVGYRQMWQYLSGEYSFDEMRDKGIVATRQLAKRQLTWLRGWQKLNWIYTQDEEGKLKNSHEIVREALNFLDKRSI